MTSPESSTQLDYSYLSDRELFLHVYGILMKEDWFEVEKLLAKLNTAQRITLKNEATKELKTLSPSLEPQQKINPRGDEIIENEIFADLGNYGKINLLLRRLEQIK